MEDNKLSLEERMHSLEAELNNLKKGFETNKEEKSNQIIIMVFSNQFDKIISAYIIASSAVMLRIKVKIFFTFWGIDALKKKRIFANKKITEKMIAMMTSKSFESLPTSNLNMMGIGPKFFKYVMKNKNISSQKELMEICRDEGVEFLACDMTMNIMGTKKEELVDGVKLTGVTTVLTEALHSNFTLFI